MDPRDLGRPDHNERCRGASMTDTVLMTGASRAIGAACHQLCCAHALRELAAVAETTGVDAGWC
jgi:hypothetical protein